MGAIASCTHALMPPPVYLLIDKRGLGENHRTATSSSHLSVLFVALSLVPRIQYGKLRCRVVAPCQRPRAMLDPGIRVTASSVCEAIGQQEAVAVHWPSLVFHSWDFSFQFQCMCLIFKSYKCSWMLSSG